jgi:hypothetical protein
LIYYEKEQWGFRKWDYCPGPGPDDIDFQSESLEMITQVDLNYYFGEPTILNKWVLPVHKHPEWDIARLHRALNTATQISLPQWQSIREEAVANRNRLHPLGTMLQIFACSFNPIAHSEDSNLTLYLRRDLAEAFIVASQDEFLMRQGG